MRNNPDNLQKVKDDPDYILSPRYDNSLKSFMKKNPKGTNDKIIATFLGITPSDVTGYYESAVKKIRQALNLMIDSGNE